MRRGSWRSVPMMCRPPAAVPRPGPSAHWRPRPAPGRGARVRGEHLRVAAEEGVGPAAGHVGGDRDGAAAARLRDDLRLLLVELGVEDVVLHAPALQHLAEHLAHLDADRSDPDRAALLVLLDELLYDRPP